MPGALGDVLQAIQAGLSEIPPAALVVGLLFGPTLAWFGYRMYAGPRTARNEAERGDLFWICAECRSANEPGRERCYLCQTHRDAMPGALRVVDRDRIVEIDDAPDDASGSPGVAVGPGRVVEPVLADESAPDFAPLTVVPFERVGKRSKRTPVAVPIEPEIDDEDADDVLAASQVVHVASTGRSRSRRSSKRDAAG